MPLHLLSKKSWNVWNADNISRVERDIARGEQIEEEQHQALREYDSLRQLALLRGETPPTPPRILSTDEIEQRVRDEARGERQADAEGRGAMKKKRRLKGEDETDMELRLAKEAVEERYGESEKQERGSRDKRRKIDAPITDPNGHINLFPIDPRDAAKQKNAEAEAEKAKKTKEFEDQYTMRFANAAGRDGLTQGPWYVTKDEKKRQQEEEAGEDSRLTYMEYKNLWGRPDPKAKDREKQRASTSDPFAMMQKAQSQLKRSEKDKQAWAEQKAKELTQLKGEQEKERRKRHKREHRHSNKLEDSNDRSERRHRRHAYEDEEDVERRERRHRKSRYSRSPDREHHRLNKDSHRHDKEDDREERHHKSSRLETDHDHKHKERRHNPSRIPNLDDLKPLSLDAPLERLRHKSSEHSYSKDRTHHSIRTES
ncbi:homocitrate synthase [Venturia nashicola]|uniref:Homocitrate synthase n=1 Tax=Venturia nashicola TaxID=86259 RepID=A0A4Z1P673_9PEZI|nr:homocitrate synthase [Venturia nashicola]